MIDPVIFSIGSLQIRYYGLVFVLGMLSVYYWLSRNEYEHRDEVLFYLIVGMFLGARFFGLVSNGVNPVSLEFFKVWNGGMAFYGGLIGTLIAGYFLKRKYNLNFEKLADLVIFPISFILIFGRLANYTNGELIGNNICNGLCPYTLIAAFLQLLLFLFLVYVYRKKGRIFYSFLVGYSLVRLIGDMFKADVRLIGLTYWQWFSILVLIIGIYYLIKKRI